MTKALKVHARNARERNAFTMHSFKSGGALTRDLAGEDLPTVMQRAFWKKLSTAWRYLRLREVLIPGSVGKSMVAGVSPEQYREITSSDSLNKVGTGQHSGTHPWYDHKRERKYGGTQSRNTNKSLIYVPTTNCIL